MGALAWRLATVAKSVNAVDHGQAGHLEMGGVEPFEVRLLFSKLCFFELLA